MRVAGTGADEVQLSRKLCNPTNHSFLTCVQQTRAIYASQPPTFSLSLQMTPSAIDTWTVWVVAVTLLSLVKLPWTALTSRWTHELYISISKLVEISNRLFFPKKCIDITIKVRNVVILDVSCKSEQQTTCHQIY